MKKLRKTLLLVGLCLGLSGCGTTLDQHLVSGAAIGAGIGVATALATDEDPINGGAIGAGLGIVGGLIAF